MKIVKKITRIRLEDSSPCEYVFIGIVSAEPDYKLSLLLNTKFRISLKHSSPLRLADGSAESSFSRFSTATSSSGPSYSLVANRCGKEYLIKKLRNVDYIFISHDHENKPDADRLASDLRSTDSITAVFKIDPDSLKEKNLQYLIH